MTTYYDLDGCYSLLIAIILNVGASKAWSLYKCGRKRKSLCDTFQLKKSDGAKSDLKTMTALKQRGFSNEAIAECMNCDPSTVKRKLREWRKEENDG